MHQHTWLHNETPYFLCNLKKNALPPLYLISHLPYIYVHVHPLRARTHKLTSRVFHQKSVQVLPGNWEMGGGVLICFNWTFSMATASWCEPVRGDVRGTLTQWQRSSGSSDPIKKQGEGVEVLSSLALLMSNRAKEKPPEDPESCCICFYFVSLTCFSLKLRGHDLDQQSVIRTEEADITDSWRLSPQAAESAFIATFKVNCCSF